MSDLISRKALLAVFEEHKQKSSKLHELIFFDAVMAIIDNQPTVFDVDKVVEQLKECERYVYDAVSDEDNYVIDTEKAIEIVKGAVKE